MRWATTWERERERERECVCVFSNPPLMTFQRLWTWGGRRKEDDGIWFLGWGWSKWRKETLQKKVPFLTPLLLGILVAAACLFFFDLFYGLVHTWILFLILYSLTYQLPFFVDFGFQICHQVCIHIYIFAIIVIVYIKLLTNPVMYLIMVMDKK